MKRIAISAGPIPARLDPVKFITNRFKGGLALVAASYLAKQPDFEVTLVMWKHADMSHVPGSVKQLVTVDDVFEYYDWFVANANNFDAFVMAAAVANLTPAKPYGQKFPSHLYKPGEEFDIKFMIAPRAIDAIKPLNPRACLIGYKLYDEPDDGKLADIARHTLKDARANVIFANHPATAKDKKIAVTADGAAIPMSFKQHLEFMARAIRQEYFITELAPLSDSEKSDPNIREALASASMYEHTFNGFGTVAVPVKNHELMFATTSRGHGSGPVIVRDVDAAAGIVTASGKATLNAPALYALLKKNGRNGIVVHRHFDDPNADPAKCGRYLARCSDAQPHPSEYVFPGTLSEYDMARDAACDKAVSWFQPYHGYLSFLPFRNVDWTKYYQQFPQRYFAMPADMLNLVKWHREEGLDVLEIGGNRKPMGNYSYDPYVNPDPDFARAASWDDVASRKWPLAVCFNSVNYLTGEELRTILDNCGAFAANTFAKAPDEKSTDEEYAVKAGSMVRHGLRLQDDSLARHRFHAYSREDFEAMGLSCIPYGRNSMMVFKGITPAMGVYRLLPGKEAPAHDGK